MKNANKVNNATILAMICSAAALLAAVFFVQPSVSTAEEAVKDRDYQVVTARVANGSDALYILDNRSGMMGVFVYQPGRGLELKGKEPIGNAFGGK
jgi:hypothetical protein